MQTQKNYFVGTFNKVISILWGSFKLYLNVCYLNHHWHFFLGTRWNTIETFFEVIHHNLSCLLLLAKLTKKVTLKSIQKCSMLTTAKYSSTLEILFLLGDTLKCVVVKKDNMPAYSYVEEEDEIDANGDIVQVCTVNFCNHNWSKLDCFSNTSMYNNLLKKWPNFSSV